MCDRQIYKHQTWPGPSSSFQAKPAVTEATCLSHCHTGLSYSICAAKDNLQGWCGLQEAVSCLLDKKDDMG